jgi:hypothetical protein
MIIADIPHNLPSIDAAECTEHRAPSRFKVLEEPQVMPPLTYTLRKTILQIEPGRLHLRLRQPPEVLVHPDGVSCEVIGWSVTVPTARAEDIPSEMSRKFLDLFSKADRGRLNETEQAEWIDILDHVDFQTFCIDRAQPHYMEGEVTSISTKFVWVEWHDGAREKIETPAHRSLFLMQKGDLFGAYVKLGRDNRTLSIENVLPLNDRTFIDSSQ